MNLSDLRKEYSAHPLRRADLDPSPISLFEKWFTDAQSAKIHEPNAMTLSTVSGAGLPSQRTVLLKQFDEKGFVFFTNYGSKKAQDIANNPAVSILFPWIEMERQIIIQGHCEKISQEESAAYFHSRPFDSQIGAWASQQSTTVPNRDFLEKSFAELTQKYKNAQVPLPDFWGGFRIIPSTIEFWQGGGARIHDRFHYQFTNKSTTPWEIQRLSP